MVEEVIRGVVLYVGIAYLGSDLPRVWLAPVRRRLHIHRRGRQWPPLLPPPSD
jgi:hypothetical protein